MFLLNVIFKLPKGRYITTLRLMLGVILLYHVPLFSQNVGTRMIYVLDTENHYVSGVKLKVDFHKKRIEGVTKRGV